MTSVTNSGMKSNIFIPKNLKIGFQNRQGTYTGKLAFIIYYDEKGKLRQEVAWRKWRDETIESVTCKNVPTEGFILNKKVGGYSTGWNHRQTYCRVFDPRGFEFEITISNLMYILENTNCLKGKGLEGEFVYGWDGKDLILMPCESPDYKELQDYSDLVQKRSFVKVKELVVGGTYLGTNNSQYIYMGRYDAYIEMCRVGSAENPKWYKSCADLPIQLVEDHWGVPPQVIPYNYVIGPAGYTAFFFAQIRDGKVSFTYRKNLSGFLIKILDGTQVPNYAELFEELQSYPYYSPPNELKDWVRPYTFEEFQEKMSRCHSYGFPIIHAANGRQYEMRGVWEPNMGWKDDQFQFNEKGPRIRDDTPIHTLKEIVELLQPMRCTRYLDNGKFYKEIY